MIPINNAKDKTITELDDSYEVTMKIQQGLSEVRKAQEALARTRSALEDFYAGNITQKEHEEKIVAIANNYDGELLQ